jgi:hypothetical protein
MYEIFRSIMMNKEGMELEMTFLKMMHSPVSILIG